MLVKHSGLTYRMVTVISYETRALPALIAVTLRSVNVVFCSTFEVSMVINHVS